MQNLREMIKLIDPKYQAQCFKLLDDNLELFSDAFGSSHNHQAWIGGYLDHIEEVMNIGMILHTSLSSIRNLGFSISDVLLILFLHDLEKPWKNLKKFSSKNERHLFRLEKISEYDFQLEEYQLEALKYVEGEGNDYSNINRVMSPLAAICHMADVASARIWFNYPTDRKYSNTIDYLYRTELSEIDNMIQSSNKLAK